MKIPRFLAFAVLAAFAHAANAAPGDLDLRFGNGGTVVTDVTGGADYGSSVALQPDGKIVVAGGGTSLGLVVVRYNGDGSVDTSFNGTGRVAVGFGGTDPASGVAIQPDGKIIVAGTTSGMQPTDFRIARLQANGLLDGTFGTNGRVTTFIGFNNDKGNCVAVQPDGKILVAGYAANPVQTDFAVVRYNTNGSLDTSFNGIGKVTTDIGGTSDTAYAMAIQTDGKIVVAGGSYNPTNGFQKFALVRYGTDGSLDPSFIGTGIVTTRIGVGNAIAFCVVLQGDGKLLVGGFSTIDNVNTSFTVARYNSNGTLDPTFGTGGVVQTPNTYDQAYGIALQKDGKIVLGGTNSIGGSGNFGIMRYNPNGSLDSTFNGSGIVTTSFPGYTNIGGSGVAIQNDGTIVLAGRVSNTKPNFALARYLGVPLVPDIAVEQPTGSDLVDGSATVDFGVVVAGSAAERIFTIRNQGGVDLAGIGITFDGVDRSDFAVSASPSGTVPAPIGFTTFTVRFLPSFAGIKTAALHIASDDPDENPFDVILTGHALGPNADADGDGMTNSAEANLAAFGFDPLANDSARLSLFRVNGLYQASDMQTLAFGSPLLTKDPANGHFHLSIALQKSANMGNWSPLVGFTPTYDPQTGRIDIEITPDASNAQFYRVLGSKP